MNREESPQPQKRSLPQGIWALGMVSLLMDTSSEIVHGLLPVFLVTTLGAAVTTVGVLDGLAEATTLVWKVFSGPLSDRLGKRKPLVVLGYTIGALSKPLFALAPSVGVVFGARLFDRTGKGIRGAPRDALVADLAPPELRGRAFGLRQSLDTVGAFLGPILAIGLMHLTANQFRTVFGWATLPGILAVVVLVIFVKEREGSGTETPYRKIKLSDLKEFQASFWRVVGAGSLFQLARFSEAFLILRAKDFGLSLSFAPLVLVIMNVIYSVSSYPVGHLSDQIKREWFLLSGLLTLLVSDLVLGLGTSLMSAWVGVALWGLHMGLTQGTLAALVADTCPPDRRGTSYGIFNLFSAAALLLASTLAGVLWDQLGPKATFLAGAGLCLASGLAFLVGGVAWTRKN